MTSQTNLLGQVVEFRRRADQASGALDDGQEPRVTFGEAGYGKLVNVEHVERAGHLHAQEPIEDEAVSHRAQKEHLGARNAGLDHLDGGAVDLRKDILRRDRRDHRPRVGVAGDPSVNPTVTLIVQPLVAVAFLP